MIEFNVQDRILLSNLGISQDQLEGTVDEIVETLTDKVRDYNISYEKGEEEVSNTLYDRLRGILKKLKPDADVLNEVYAMDYGEIDKDKDKYLTKIPMKSIETIKEMRDLDRFRKELQDLVKQKGIREIECVSSFKLNGHAGRAAIHDGKVVSASTKGRYKRGRDTTNHLSVILSDKNLTKLSSLGLVELRGEIVLNKHALSKARKFNPDIKSVFSAVSSLIRPYATEDEIKLLNFVAYDIYGDNVHQFNTLEEKFEYLESLGFEVPLYATATIAPFGSFEDDIEEILDVLGEHKETYQYDTDGIVTSINDVGIFNSLGSDTTINRGNVALKMGKWQQEVYSSIIEKIEFCQGKSKITPKAVVRPVVVENGNTVRNVPLYNLAALELLEAYEGETIHFKYGGEAGVIPCDADGNVIGTLYKLMELGE